MSDNYCSICDLRMATKQSFQNHLKTKTHYLKANNEKREYPCLCSKIYKSRQARYLHRRTCAVYQQYKTVDSAPVDSDTGDSARDTTTSLHPNLDTKKLLQRINNLEQNNLEQKVKIFELEKKIANSTQTTIYNTTHNHNTTIIINPFGFENLDHITDKDMLKCISMVYESVPSLFEKVHYNPEHPENNNIRIPNKKQPYIKIMDPNGKWKLVDKDYTINALVYKYVDMLTDTFKERKNTYPLKKRERIKELYDKVWEEDPETIKKISKNTELMILNNSK